MKLNFLYYFNKINNDVISEKTAIVKKKDLTKFIE